MCVRRAGRFLPELFGWDSPTHRVLDVLDTDRFIALARRREAVSELELAPAHVRMLTTDVRLRKLSSQKCVLQPAGSIGAGLPSSAKMVGCERAAIDVARLGFHLGR